MGSPLLKNSGPKNAGRSKGVVSSEGVAISHLVLLICAAIRCQTMTDTMSKAERSRRMQLIRSKDTRPEIIVRRLVTHMGYRYRLHYSNLPGKPDMVFVARRKAIIINGCFWHRHKKCRLARMPKSKLEYWRPKLEANVIRDASNRRALRQLDWREAIVWECELRNHAQIVRRLRRFLGPTYSSSHRNK